MSIQSVELDALNENRTAGLGEVRLLGLDNLIDDAILLRLLGCHEEVAISVLLDLVERLTGRVRHVAVEEGLDEEDLLCLDLNVCSLTLGSSERLMDHDTGIGQRLPLARSSRAEQEGTHGCSCTEADGGSIARDVLHGIIDCHPRGDRSSRRVDVDSDVLAGILVRQEQHLSNEVVGDFVVHVSSQEQDPVLCQSRVDVHLTLTNRNHGHGNAGLGRRSLSWSWLGLLRHHHRTRGPGCPNVGLHRQPEASSSARGNRKGRWSEGRGIRRHGENCSAGVDKEAQHP
mmetsp:Transcript_10790/g.24526  ORF Transcript_10790/g.24526 Transcript_10790/m.24526 type:complete len:287 (-) Transcript_10790:3-863(-)